MEKGTVYHVAIQAHGRTPAGEFEGELVWEQGGFAQFKVTKAFGRYDQSTVNTTVAVRVSHCKIERVEVPITTSEK